MSSPLFTGGPDLLEFGHSIQLAGAVYSSADELYVLLFPDEPADRPATSLQLTPEQWQRLIRQTDLLETEILVQAEDGKIVKAVVRKSTRQIEQGVSWNVFRRDGYRCRYCWNDKVPLTVDHLVLWEDGGPSVEANLVAACRRCNKTRGRTPYAEWLTHPYYLKVSSRSLPHAVQEANRRLLGTLGAIPRRVHKRGR